MLDALCLLPLPPPCSVPWETVQGHLIRFSRRLEGWVKSEVRQLFLLLLLSVGPEQQWLRSLTEGIADAMGALPRFLQPPPRLMYNGGSFRCKHLPLSA